jgi:hypothetical protein
MKQNKNTTPATHGEEHGLPQEVVTSLRLMVENERQASMMSMPTERVMRAVRAANSLRKESFLERELISWFRPVMALGVVIILALVVYNVDLSRQNDHFQTPTEMVFGLHPVTVAAAYDIEFDHHE